jgi:pyruvate dehydrogenase E2 component (dihydrolipoamide acetyltransferase)
MRDHIVPAVPAARWKARAQGMDLAVIKGSGPGGVVLLRDLKPERQVSKGETVRVSPLARKLAQALGVPLEGLCPSPASGRITLEDVIQAARGGLARRGSDAPLLGETIPMEPMRRAIARRMSQSAQTAPHIHLFADMEMDRLEQVREELGPAVQERVGVKLSINDLLIKATALTLREFPMLNASLQGDEILVAPRINVGLAVAVPQGLLVPAIPGADELGLGQIARIRCDLVDRARAGRLKLEEMERGTFTISSLARYEILFFTAILNPPQSGLLTVGRTHEEVVLRGGKVQSRRVARMGLSADHRIVDGAKGAEFLQALKARVERPASFLVELG